MAPVFSGRCGLAGVFPACSQPPARYKPRRPKQPSLLAPSYHIALDTLELPPELASIRLSPKLHPSQTGQPGASICKQFQVMILV